MTISNKCHCGAELLNLTGGQISFSLNHPLRSFSPIVGGVYPAEAVPGCAGGSQSPFGAKGGIRLLDMKTQYQIEIVIMKTTRLSFTITSGGGRV